MRLIHTIGTHRCNRRSFRAPARTGSARDVGGHGRRPGPGGEGPFSGGARRRPGDVPPPRAKSHRGAGAGELGRRPRPGDDQRRAGLWSVTTPRAPARVVGVHVLGGRRQDARSAQLQRRARRCRIHEHRAGARRRIGGVPAAAGAAWHHDDDVAPVDGDEDAAPHDRLHAAGIRGEQRPDTPCCTCCTAAAATKRHGP